MKIVAIFALLQQKLSDGDEGMGMGMGILGISGYLEGKSQESLLAQYSSHIGR